MCKRTVQLDNTVLSIATHGTFVAIGSTTIRLLSSSMETWRRSVLDTDLDYEAIEEVITYFEIQAYLQVFPPGFSITHGWVYSKWSLGYSRC